MQTGENIVNQLVYSKGKYTIDFSDFEEKIIENKVKLFILCSPHNSVGRVWSKEELVRIGELCLKHGVLVISDEIHADFTYPGHRHLVFADLKPEFSDITITCTAPTKTFNLAGLQISNIFISNQEIRRRFKKEIAASGTVTPILWVSLHAVLPTQVEVNGSRSLGSIFWITLII